MDLCIKTLSEREKAGNILCFNPCFNGSMYKNWLRILDWEVRITVSILVLMDLCIKTIVAILNFWESTCFNPCFNGSMYKN